jgi:hypothetical protein
MFGIGRPSVVADVVAITVRLDISFLRIVVRFAKRLQFAEPKFHRIAFVRLNVIGDGRGRDLAEFEAKLAKRMFLELNARDLAPAFFFVEASGCFHEQHVAGQRDRLFWVLTPARFACLIDTADQT